MKIKKEAKNIINLRKINLRKEEINVTGTNNWKVIQFKAIWYGGSI